MEIQLTVALFLKKLQKTGISQRTCCEYQHELERFTAFFTAGDIYDFKNDGVVELFDDFFYQRTLQLSVRHRNTISYKFRRYFHFLHKKRIVKNNTLTMIRYIARTVKSSPSGTVFREMRKLDTLLSSTAAIGYLRDRFDSLKKEMLLIAGDHPEISATLFQQYEDKIENITNKSRELFDKRLDELIRVGAFLSGQDLSVFQTELSGLAKNLKKFGREIYKINMLFETKQETDNQIFPDLQRRIQRTEKMVKELLDLKNELKSGANLQLIKNLLPVLDGFAEALATIPGQELSSSSVDSTQKEKKFWQKIFLSRNAGNEALPEAVQTWREGLELIYRRLLKVLQDEGVRPILSVGGKFDPQQHIAVGVENNQDIPAGYISREHLKGYKKGQQIIRYAEVIVVKQQEKNL